MPNHAAQATPITRIAPPGLGIKYAASMLHTTKNAINRNVRDLLIRTVTRVDPRSRCSHRTSTPLIKTKGFKPTQFLLLYSFRSTFVNTSGVLTDTIERLAAVYSTLSPDKSFSILECPANFVPGGVRETGTEGAFDGTREEAYT
jgi:hypothetical protein